MTITSRINGRSEVDIICNMLDVRLLFCARNILHLRYIALHLLSTSGFPQSFNWHLCTAAGKKKLKELNGLDPRNFHTFLNPSLTSSVYIIFLSMDDHRIHKNPEKWIQTNSLVILPDTQITITLRTLRLRYKMLDNLNPCRKIAALAPRPWWCQKKEMLWKKLLVSFQKSTTSDNNIFL